MIGNMRDKMDSKMSNHIRLLNEIIRDFDGFSIKLQTILIELYEQENCLSKQRKAPKLCSKIYIYINHWKRIHLQSDWLITRFCWTFAPLVDFKWVNKMIQMNNFFYPSKDKKMSTINAQEKWQKNYWNEMESD